MSLIFCEGFDDSLLDQKWGYAYRALGYSGLTIASGGRRSNCLRVAEGRLKHTVSAAAHATMIWGVALRSASGQDINSTFINGAGMTLLGDGGTVAHVSVEMVYASGASEVRAYRGDNSGGKMLGGGAGTLLGSASISTLTPGQWYYLEAKVVASSSTGSVTVRINGTTVLSLTNVNTLNGGVSATYDTLGIGHGNGGYMLDYDDLYWCNGAGTTNNDFLGDITVETLLPIGDGSSSQWVGSDGNSTSNYALVNEATPDTASYVQSGTTGQRDLYAYGDLTSTAGTVYGVQATSYAQVSSNSVRSIKNAVKSGATVAVSASAALTTTATAVTTVQETDPNGGAAWTIAAVNAAEIGVEVG